jgi:hypothetical protein
MDKPLMNIITKRLYVIGILALWACKSRREGGGELGFNSKTEVR